MRKFMVNVNGTSYEVAVEEIAGAAPSPVAPPKPAPAAPAPAPAAPPAPAPLAGDEIIACPMPGNIFKVMCNTGDTVKEGDVMFILEAMKMENEIMAPRAGTVKSVNVQVGATVNSGDVLAVIG